MTDTLNPRSWLYPTPRGLYCEPGDFYVDPAVAVTRAVITHGHGDHARPGHRNALATPETLAIMRARFQDMPDTSQQPLKYGESVRIGDVEVSLVPAGHILGSAQAVLEHKGQRIVVSGDYKRRPDADLPAVRAGAVRRLHHRGDLRAAGLPSSLRHGRDRQAPALARDLSRAHSSGGRLCAGQVPAGDQAAARRGLRQAHLAARRAGLAVHALPAARRRSRRHRAGLRRDPRDLQGRDRALPALGDGRPLVAPLRRADPGDGLGLDGRARPRPPARRRAAADHLRPCRLVGTHA